MRLLVPALLAACSFQHGGASNGAAADGGRDAPVQGDASTTMRDAPPDAPPDAATTTDACVANLGDCLTAGGGCVDGTCVITLFANLDVTCPANMPCEVVCAGEGTCSGHRIACAMATSCTIDCAAANTCNGSQFDCDHVGCTINCLVDGICDGFQVTDNGSACTLACCGGGNECNGDAATPNVCADGNSTCP
ncbi:MAG TPA: hypothetical protein VGF94_30220 [Kofleriaceae bacterium]|jgi:hypothetical protein